MRKTMIYKLYTNIKMLPYLEKRINGLDFNK